MQYQSAFADAHLGPDPRVLTISQKRLIYVCKPPFLVTCVKRSARYVLWVLLLPNTRSIPLPLLILSPQSFH